ncbi:MAG: nitroreductase family protein [Bacteroidetes bacterium]|nr:nitroreductase family protein [Bacteroidota bacterium]
MQHSSNFIPYEHPLPFTQEQSYKNVLNFYHFMETRRSLRAFSDRPVDLQTIELIIKTAATAPSGAHKQPWTFCAVQNPSIKKQIREAAEKEEYESYHGRMSEEWLNDLKPFETDWHKPFLESAPWLIVIFKKIYDWDGEGKKTNYYVNESVGIATGLLITAIHHAGLVTLTHTPSPMNFLSTILDRPSNERPFLLLPVGYPPENAMVPDLKRKEMDEVCVVY